MEDGAESEDELDEHGNIIDAPRTDEDDEVNDQDEDADGNDENKDANGNDENEYANGNNYGSDEDDDDEDEPFQLMASYKITDRRVRDTYG